MRQRIDKLGQEEEEVEVEAEVWHTLYATFQHP
jgi:hypothetical protein